jgi:hypothetical protein
MDNVDHLARLERLWNAVRSGTRFPGKSSPVWKELGFQSDTPASDFRGMGLLGLEQLVFYCETCATEAKMVFDTQHASDSDAYYPVATAGVNVSSLVLNAAESLLKSGTMSPVFLCTNDAINKVWIVVFRHLDTLFVEQGLRYLQFTELTKGVAVQLNEALRQTPLSCDALAAALKALGVDSLGLSSGTGTPKKRNKVRSAAWPAASIRSKVGRFKKVFVLFVFLTLFSQ